MPATTPATATFSTSRTLTEALGLFGGTFDPVHFGHLRLAEEAIGELGLGGVRWIPAGQPPHRDKPQATGRQRLEMVLRSTAGNARFSVDASEVAAAAPSYAVHTLERLRGELGAECSLVMLVGADAFAGLPAWHRWRDLFDLAHIAVSQRPGFPVEAGSLPPELDAEFAARRLSAADELKQAPAGGIATFTMTQLAISATRLRELLATGKSVRYLLPDSVLDYINLYQLYKRS
jgi:nicotinate-nucleotide adenylyltransferase